MWTEKRLTAFSEKRSHFTAFLEGILGTESWEYSKTLYVVQYSQCWTLIFQLLLTIILILIPGKGACEEGWSSLPDGDSCYRYINSTIYTWYSARSICHDLGGDLPSIHSQEENDFLRSEEKSVLKLHKVCTKEK